VLICELQKRERTGARRKGKGELFYITWSPRGESIKTSPFEFWAQKKGLGDKESSLSGGKKRRKAGWLEEGNENYLLLPSKLWNPDASKSGDVLAISSLSDGNWGEAWEVWN